MAMFIDDREYGVNKVLWSGAWYMNETQTITLSQAISDQPHGAVFVFSYYNTTDNEARDYDWFDYFVPKHHVEKHNSQGIYMVNPYRAMQRYLYVSDTSVKGHANNNSTGTQNGIAWNNTTTVLRYVIGV